MRYIVNIFLFLLLSQGLYSYATPNLPSEFSSNEYKPMDLNQYCSNNYGSQYHVIRYGNHAYDWKCTNGSTNYDIDVGLVCIQQWSPNYTAVLVGNHAYDWKCINWAEAENKIVPVLIVSSENIYNISAVNSAIERFANVVLNTQSWYREKMDSGKTFSLLQPIIKLSLKNNKFWNDASCITSDSEYRPLECSEDINPDADRFYLFYQMVNETEYIFDSKPESTKIISPISAFSGEDSQPFYLGAASSTYKNHGRAVVGPSTAVCAYSDPYCGVYAVGHEMGHNFGLGHTCQESGNASGCYNSIMQNPGSNIGNAILMNFEQDILNSSPFFDVGKTKSSVKHVNLIYPLILID